MHHCDYSAIVSECETDLRKYGDTFEGVGWTKKKDYAELRYKVMLEGLRPSFPRPLTLLDFGCGCSHLYEHIVNHGIEGITYSGLDLSDQYLEVCRQKFPRLTYYKADLLRQPQAIPNFDFIVMNGIFTYKGDNTYDAMFDYFRRLVTAAARHARLGFAFNVMTKYLDWERDDLFHVPLDAVAAFLNEAIGRSFVFRHDYGLYEYTVYVYMSDLSADL